MHKIVSIGPRRAGRLAVALGCTVALAVLTGCQAPAKSGQTEAKGSQQGTATAKQPEQKAPAAKPAPAPRTAEAKPQKSDDLARAVDKGEQPKDVDRDALAELIRQRIMEGRKSQPPAEQKSQKTAEQKAAPSQNLSNANARRTPNPEPTKAPAAQEQPAPTAQTREPKMPAQQTPPPTREAAPQREQAPQHDADTKSTGCGSATGSADFLAAPTPDSPQPKLLVAEPKVTVDSVWQGTPAVFRWAVKNEGEGPLNIRIKGG